MQTTAAFHKMGRKPNAIVLEYFSRGPKLEDSSNRYQHTCKQCGHHFPKGRIDSLTTHLIKKCPALSLQQRTSIVLQLHDLHELDVTQPFEHNGRKQKKSARVTLPYSPVKQNFNGLNVLAEASRRVGANDEPQVRSYNGESSSQAQGMNLDPSLDPDSFANSFLNLPEDNVTNAINGEPSHTYND